ncbi:hypothetical protein C8F04DRAFT_991964 [Mycena alexandri]|uniref:Uncharacterized protein n=1 Tax=Mycena alexandri TaxID=1745969 RepID=A0AAD6TCE2_9AGAR|nr:hypothetical protein C8F04DRAFT_991964 [Mycena alexandri]
MIFSLYSSGSRLPSQASAGSLDLSHCVLDDSLMTESLTLSSLSSSTSSTPPIPAGCMVPLATIIGHHEGPTMACPNPLRKLSKATLTSPTPPRLRTMLREKLLVETWLSGVGSDSSEHTPWGGISTAEPIPWKSEGSIHSPQNFKTKMALARGNHLPESNEQDQTISLTGPPDALRRSTKRNARVFEREIILNSGGGKSARVSLQASAKAMDPEVAEMISELQNLNAFFKEQGASPSDRHDAPPPPALIVSNSHFSLPVSLESSGNLTPGAPLGLAARRGKKMPAPLSFKQSSDDNAYPSMPTAFLGSPSTYSPKFEFASNPNRGSMDLQQMVTSLRSQCASIDSPTSLEAVDEDEDEGTEAGSEAGSEADEWAFADGLLDVYSSRSFGSDFVKKPLRPDMVDYAEEALTHGASFTCGPVSPMNAPPSTPLPPCPTPHRASVRSILKSTKSVRFASLPNERPESVEIIAPSVRAPRRSLGSSSPPSKRPLPLRPRSHTVRPTIPTPFRSPLPKSTPTLGRIPGQRRATTTATPRPLTSPATSPTRPYAAAAPIESPPKKVSSSGRHSLRSVFSSAPTTPKETSAAKETKASAEAKADKETKVVKETKAAKENKPAGSPTPPAPGRARWTLNENVLRRASISGSLTQKTRMPVPLRNILTRFK